MNINTITKEKLIEYTRNFYEQYLYLCDIHNIYQDSHIAEVYGNPDTKMYFCMVASACIDSYMMTLARLYDKKSRNSDTIYKLIRICKYNKNFFANPEKMFDFLTERGEFLKKEEFLNNAITVIRHRRNKYIAHNDAEYFSHSLLSDKAVQDHSYMPFYEVWMLVNFTGDLLEKILAGLGVKPDMNCKYNREFFKLFPELEIHRINPLQRNFDVSGSSEPSEAFEIF